MFGILRSVTFSTLLLLGCARERGVESQSRPPVVYAGGTYYTDNNDPDSKVHVVYALDADSLQVIDSTFLATSCRALLASRDGKLLFYNVHDPASWPPWMLFGFDRVSRDTVWTVPNAVTPCAADGGRRILVESTGNTIQVLDGHTGAVVGTLDSTFTHYAGNYRGRHVPVAVKGDGPTVVSALDAYSFEVSGRYIPRLLSGTKIGVRLVVLHPDEQRVLVIGVRSSTSDSWFVVGDLRNDSTLFEMQLVYPFGEIAVSADGSLAAVSDPSRPMIHDSRRTLSILDLRSMVRIKRFVEPDLFHPAQLRMIPGSDRLACFPIGGSGGPLQIVDLRSLALSATVWLGEASGSDTPELIVGAFEVSHGP